MATRSDVEAGQAVYTRPVLKIYDWLVLGLSNRWIWKCPTPRILALYDAHVSANHLDVGVGTGYYLDKCRFPSAEPRLALMDLNPQSLATAARRVARYRPEQIQANVLEPLDREVMPFDSIGLNYLLHCLPGSIATKAVVFDHLQPLLNPGGTVFGATLLQGDVERSATARRLMAVYNAKGIFTNTEDDLAGLEVALADRFAEHTVEIVGCGALFSARAGP